MQKYSVRKCPCGCDQCPDFHVSPVAAVWGVGFTEKQAEAVAKLLNEMEEDKD